MLVVVLSMCLCAQGQVRPRDVPAPVGNSDAIHPLSIGEAIPETLWNLPVQVVNHPEGKDAITLNDYRDKLIILDFWASWCVPCISSLSKLDSLQQQFGEEVYILPVTYESSAKAQSTFARHGWQLPTVVADSVLASWFPHKTLPHHVWLQGDKVVAITHHAYSHADNIRAQLQGEEIHLPAKEQPDSGPVAAAVDTLYRVTISSHNPTLPTRFSRSDSRILADNLDITALYRSAYSGELPYSGWNNRIILELDSTLQQQVQRPYRGGMSGDYRRDSLLQAWNRQHTYSYQLHSSHPTSRSALLAQMQADLNRYFGSRLGIHGSIQPRRIHSWVLQHNGRPPRYQSQQADTTIIHIDSEGLEAINYPMYRLVDRLATANRHLSQALTDGTGYTGNVSLKLDAALQDIPALNRALAPYGLELKAQEQEVNVLLITQDPRQQ